MGNIIWDSVWNIGHAEIDKQHQKWVEIFNRLEQAVLTKDNEDLDGLTKDTLKEMVDYTRYHFNSEEQVMQEMGYPESYHHWRLHKDFDGIIYEKFRSLENGSLILNSDLLSLIKNWLLQHIQIEDKKIGIYSNLLNEQQHPAAGKQHDF